jgi:hypothetical protein
MSLKVMTSSATTRNLGATSRAAPQSSDIGKVVALCALKCALAASAAIALSQSAGRKDEASAPDQPAGEALTTWTLARWPRRRRAARSFL